MLCRLLSCPVYTHRRENSNPSVLFFRAPGTPVKTMREKIFLSLDANLMTIRPPNECAITSQPIIPIAWINASVVSAKSPTVQGLGGISLPPVAREIDGKNGFVLNERIKK